MTNSSVVTVTHEGDIAWVEIDNPPVNATSTAVRAGLTAAAQQVQGARVAILTCAGRTFVAGGDISEFDRAPEEPHLPDVVQMIEDSETPFVAAMHGNVLGGGFEIAMGCAWRIAAPGTKFGLPEVNVGLIPGAGGTQRAPRLIGMQAAIDMACSGKILPAETLLDLGGVDQIAQGDLKDAARTFAQNLPNRPVKVRDRVVAALPLDEYAATETALKKRAKGQQSPILNLEALQWAALPFEQGQPVERALHLKLRHSVESRALRYAFFAERAVSKPKLIDGIEPRPLNQIAIVGGGLMGAGIAMACLSGCLSVTLIERDNAAANAARTRVDGLIEGGVKRGKFTVDQQADMLAHLTTTDSYADAADADLAIEAVFEDLDVKRDVFRQLAAVIGPDAILATNTSYLDPTLIFDGMPNLSRCLGLHFFSPAHVMKLLEIVKTPNTTPEVIATGFALGKRLRKVSVLSGICDGFIGNRMLAAFRREAEYLLADGALPHQVDSAMREAGLPMGPFELQDLTGLQIAWANRKRQAATRDPNERYERIADTLCEMDRLGQRSGKGWYRYKDASRAPIRDEDVEELIVAYSKDNGLPRQNFTPNDIADRLLEVLAREGQQIVDEGIADRAEDVDVVKLFGYGFPRWRGGPMFLAKAKRGKAA
ncbi:FAD-dependent oxidoreductase [Tropicibacter sp. Alg240-R139]|uniref:FAD-dependent oxidoreductase n=1 Tax=Tropicibacter sp. Alg240-R139 TaxID=2305991 RepID=UPI0013DFF918|nr:FAD-dependent oxidoreductase [Tropicibacter sp. Alg240-R139]